MKQLYFLFFTIFTITSYAQIGIGTTTPNAALEIASTTNGVVIPRIELTSKLTQAPVVNPQGGALPEGTLIWNTATAGIAPNNVTPGFYFWSATSWNAIAGIPTKDWSLSGNAITAPTTEFLGTTTNQDLRIRTNNAPRFDFTNNGRLRAYDNGLVNLPTYSWIGDENTGMWRPKQDFLAFTTNGVDRLRIPDANQIFAMSLGTAALPFYTFDADFNTGVFSPSSDALGFSTNGVERFRIPNANQVHAMSLGTAAAPFYSFSSDNNTGIYSEGADVLNFSTNGAERMRILANGRVSINTTTPDPGDQFTVVSTGSAINGYGNQIGVYGQSTSANGIGLFGVVESPASHGVAGLTNTQLGGGTYGKNTNTSGTGAVGVGNNITPAQVLPTGSGGSFTGYTTGLYSFFKTPGDGEGLLVNDNYGFEVRVGSWIGFTGYKIVGNGSVSTIVKDLKDKNVIMHCAEAPEGLLEDYGIGKLQSGKVKILIDPILAKNIKVSEQFPMKVFIQLEGECNGVYVTNKSATSFEVIELQNGNSNVSFSYSIIANRADEVFISKSTGEKRTSIYSNRFSPGPAETKMSPLDNSDPKK